ncbi:MAG: hypothetical protein FVQ81_13735 [Candidatus Glassbacteria bacterium]|nr:hypothetical protein [Candidatus Glassbacteria bacterium]
MTHPLLREGLAVALGGRGGRDAPVILDVGCFLLRSSLVELDSLCSERAYLEEAVSFSYPASGIYVRFLLETLGLDSVLALYRRYSRPDRDTADWVIDPADLPANKSWRDWLDRWRQFAVLRPADTPPEDGGVILELEGATVWDRGEKYCFRLDGDLTFSEADPPDGYRSSRFQELFPEQAYPGCRYLVSIRDREIGVYDLYLNTLLANRVPPFMFPAPEPAADESPLIFSVDKSLFTIPLEELVPLMLE